MIEPASLSQRRGHGRLWFNWYRLRLTVPERVGDFETVGSTIVFETALDDYAEIWVDGELARSVGQTGGSVVGGWNAPNRLVIARDVRPGQQIQLAVFGIKVDRAGNLYVAGPGGLWVISPAGRLLGTIRAPRHIHNIAWGDDDRTLYLCARDALYRLRLRRSKSRKS